MTFACANCGRPFTRRSNSQRFCRYACHQAAYERPDDPWKEFQLPYDHPDQVRADVAAVKADAQFWLTPALDCAYHAERLLAEVERLRKEPA